MSAKQAINDQLQGSVAAYLRCGGVVNKETADRKSCTATVDDAAKGRSEDG